MKKIFLAVMALLVSAIVFIACTDNDSSNVTKENALSSIKKDLLNKKYFPQEKNKYDYSSRNFLNVLEKNKSLFNKNSLDTSGRSNLSIDDYKTAVVDYYKDTEHSSTEISDKFDYSLSMISKYDNYQEMLNDFVEKGIIPTEEKDIILSYIDYFFNVEDFNSFVAITSTFTHYVNESNFSEFEKRGMLTVFDTFKANKKLLEKEYSEYKFLELIQSNETDVSGKATLSQKCAGNMIIGMVGGGLTGNGIGFVVGFAGGLWSCYADGCFG